jgi:hypothetical protein
MNKVLCPFCYYKSDLDHTYTYCADCFMKYIITSWTISTCDSVSCYSNTTKWYSDGRRYTVKAVDNTYNIYCDI